MVTRWKREGRCIRYSSRRCCVQLNKLTTPYQCDFLSYQPQSTSLPFRSLFRRFPPSHRCCSLLSSLPFFPSVSFAFLFLSLSLGQSFAQPVIVSSSFVTVLLTLPPPRSLRNSRRVSFSLCQIVPQATKAAHRPPAARPLFYVAARTLFRVKKSAWCIPSRLPCYGTSVLSAQLC